MTTPSRAGAAPKSKGFSINDVLDLRQRFRQHQERKTGSPMRKTGSTGSSRRRGERKESTVDEPTEFERVGAVNRPAFTKVRKNKAAFEGMKAVNEAKKEEPTVTTTKKNLSARRSVEQKKGGSLRKDRDTERDKERDKPRVPKQFVRVVPTTSSSTSSGSGSICGKAIILPVSTPKPSPSNHSMRKISKGRKTGSKRKQRSKKARGSSESLPPRGETFEDQSSVNCFEGDDPDFTHPRVVHSKPVPTVKSKIIMKAVDAETVPSPTSAASPIASTPPYARDEIHEESCVETSERKSNESAEPKTAESPLHEDLNRSTISSTVSTPSTVTDDTVFHDDSTLDVTTTESTDLDGTSTTTTRSAVSDVEDKTPSSPNLDVIAASLHVIDHCIERNLFAELMEPPELEVFNDFFTGHHKVNEHVLVIFDKMFDKILSSETLAKSEETQRDIAVLNRDKHESKTNLLDALIAKKAVVHATSGDGSKLKEKKTEGEDLI